MNLITLDFDGVVSPIIKDGGDPFPFASRTFRFGAFDCIVAEHTLDFINALHEDSGSDVRWATSWNDLTNHFHGDSGFAIPELHYIDTLDGKAEAILDLYTEGDFDKLVVVEDSRKVINDVERLSKGNENVMTVKTILHRGIEPGHIERIERFLND